MIDSTVRVSARSLSYGAKQYRAIVNKGDLEGARDALQYFRSQSCPLLRNLDICSAAYWASIVDAITARRR